jgi:predicted TIM-barrel fold metal-dependent hydrolase
MPAGFSRWVKQAVARWGFRGIKVHGFEGMPTREVCETARAFRLPILVDIIIRPEVDDMFAPEYPDVNFIIAHLGSFTDDWKTYQQVAYQLARYPNVYADTSAVRQFRYLVEAIKRGGPRKLLFGSDGPWLHPGVEIHKIRLLGLTPDEEKLILGGNILRLLRRARVGQSALEVGKIKKYHAHSGALHSRESGVRDQTLEEFEAQSEQPWQESLYRP